MSRRRWISVSGIIATPAAVRRRNFTLRRSCSSRTWPRRLAHHHALALLRQEVVDHGLRRRQIGGLRSTLSGLPEPSSVLQFAGQGRVGGRGDAATRTRLRHAPRRRKPQPRAAARRTRPSKQGAPLHSHHHVDQATGHDHDLLGGLAFGELGEVFAGQGGGLDGGLVGAGG